MSRWERDECTPELSLIPSIAEIFGITVDELLRGERNTALIGVVCADCIYQIFIIKHLALKKIIHLDEARLEQLHANSKRLKKGCIISLSIFASLALVSYLTYDVFHFVDLELYLLILFYLNAGVSFLLYCLNKFRTKH